MACVVSGNGASFQFDEFPMNGRIQSISAYSETGSSIDNTDLKDNWVKQCPGDLVDYGTIDLTVLWDSLAAADFAGDAYDIHAQGAATLMLVNGNTVKGDAFIQARSFGDFNNNQGIMATYTFVWSGEGAAPVFAVGTPPA